MSSVNKDVKKFFCTVVKKNNYDLEFVCTYMTIDVIISYI